MVSSRRSRILALSAVFLTLVFIVITTHSSSDQESPMAAEKVINEVQPTAKFSDGIDEGFIKDQEEKLKQDILKAKEEVIKVKESKDTKQTKQTKQQIVEAIEDTTGIKHSEIEAEFDPAKEFASIMAISPIVIFSKTYCGYSKALKNLLKSEYEITPAPTIVELDKHTNGKELQEYIGLKSGRKTVPNLFINGVSRGGSDDMKALHTEGKLLSSLNTWGEKNIKVNRVNAPSNS